MKRLIKGIYLEIIPAVAVLLVLSTSACAAEPREQAVIKKAVAVLHPTQGNKAQGVVTFIREGEGLRIVADIQGLTPGKHGFHIHELGDCSAPDATSAGGHFNPKHMAHSGPDAENRHVGDLGNIEADPSGQARYDRFDSLIVFSGNASIIGRSVVVHMQPDDLLTQPTGGAGGRVACGVIGLAQE